MPSILPKIFVASSSEAKQVAYDIQELLKDDAECEVWTTAMEPSKSTFESLRKWLEIADFGISVFAPDDDLNLKGGEFLATRDNVIFEAGLFIGKLGISRNFIFKPKNTPNFRLPSDLLGITTLSYDPSPENKDHRSSMRGDINEVRRAIGQLGPKAIDSDAFDQVAAVCVRVEDGVRQVCLTKTDSDRWNFPKDYAFRSEEHFEVAERAAFEVIGCQGTIARQPFARYKHLKSGAAHEVLVGTYQLDVDPERETAPTLEEVIWVPIDKTGPYFAIGRDIKYQREIQAVIDALIP